MRYIRDGHLTGAVKIDGDKATITKDALEGFIRGFPIEICDSRRMG